METLGLLDLAEDDVALRWLLGILWIVFCLGIRLVGGDRQGQENDVVSRWCCSEVMGAVVRESKMAFCLAAPPLSTYQLLAHTKNGWTLLGGEAREFFLRVAPQFQPFATRRMTP